MTRIRIFIDGKLVGDYPEKAVQTLEKLVTAVKLHLCEAWDSLEVVKNDENKTRHNKKKGN